MSAQTRKVVMTGKLNNPSVLEFFKNGEVSRVRPLKEEAKGVVASSRVDVARQYELTIAVFAELLSQPIKLFVAIWAGFDIKTPLTIVVQCIHSDHRQRVCQVDPVVTANNE